MNEKTLNSELKYHGKIMDIYRDEVELSDGTKSIREVVKKPDAVAIAALKGKNILMVRQFRYAVKQAMLEIPAGKIDDGEAPFDCAVRELEEETGYIAKNWQPLGFIYVSAGFTNEKIYLFLAEDLTYKQAKPDAGEILECGEYSLEDIRAMIKAGEINDAKTICTLMRTVERLNS
ncbi:MAG: NUDIX hydrolase [Heliobacteriaceae bacterium]|jgi:ADP-ribose pyrophosphatase|nr:NUDIX hydrolase [Heliobacteriaceae bacterium]